MVFLTGIAMENGYPAAEASSPSFDMKKAPDISWKNTFVFLLFVPLVLFVGCSAVGIHPVPEAIVEQDAVLPARVAVLPFASTIPDPKAGIVVRRMFYNFFSSLNYLDVEPGVVDEILKKKGFYEDLVAGKPVDTKKLGQFLGVDAVVFGEVTEFGKTYVLIYSDIEAGLKAKMVRCRDGKTLWKLDHTASIAQGDVPLSLTGLAATLVKSVISYNQAEKVNAASRLSLEMVDTIPNPERVTEPPPRIHVLVHNSAERLVRPGQSIRVVLMGDPGQLASWDIAGLGQRLPMAEKEPGTYVGEYLVKPGDKILYGRLTGYLRSPQGLESQWTDVLGNVFLAEPTLLSPVISRDTVLTAKHSPYFVKEALLVVPGATLSLEPGTVLWFHELGMVVQGRIVAKGTEQAPIRISGLGNSEWKGIFADNSQEANRLSYCEISKAEFGLRTADSTFSLDHCLFRDNGWGIVVDGGEAKLEHCLIRNSRKAGISARDANLSVTESLVTHNRAGGILVQDAATDIRNNDIYNNGEYDFKALSAREKTSIPGNWWGTEPPAPPRIVGDVEFEPTKAQAADSIVFERIFNE